MEIKILIVDDENTFREDFGSLLTSYGYYCKTAASVEEAIPMFQEYQPDIILTDIVMPGKSGIEMLEDVKKIIPQCSVIVMTSYGSLDTAIEAFRKGAVDYILKPLKIEEVQTKLNKLIEHKKVLSELTYLRNFIYNSDANFLLMGNSPVQQNLKNLIKKVAVTPSTVLITGETGVGKELVARSIHLMSPRKDKPFIAINCSGLPENLIESELFGHIKGAFTGALDSKSGFFDLSENGTLFLDEISEMPINAQNKLLRVLEEREYYPLGSTKSKPLNSRIIAASNKDLKKLIKEEKFREDLYFRLAVMEIPVPPLREHFSDIPELAEHFISKINKELKLNYVGIDGVALQKIMHYNFPGNIRELKNIIERAMILGDGHLIKAKDIPISESYSAFTSNSEQYNLKDALRTFEMNFIIRALESNNWNKEATSKALGINPSTLYRKMEDLNIQQRN